MKTNVNVSSCILSIMLIFSVLYGHGQWTQGTGMDGGDYRCLMKNGQDLYAGSQYGGVFLSTNNGDTWLPKFTGLPAGISVTQLMSNGTSIFAGTSYWTKMGQGVFRSDDNGETWFAKNNGIEVAVTPYFTDLYITGFAKTGGYIYTSTYRNGIFRSSNNGENWEKVFDAYGPPDSTGVGIDSTVLREIFALCSVGDVIFAGGSSGTLSQQGIHRSFDHGLTWNIVSTGLPAGFVIYQLVSSGSDLYVRGSHGFFWSPNNGDYFIGINNGISKPEGAGNGAISADGTVVYASTYDGSEGSKTYKSMNRGSSWTSIPAMSSYRVLALLNSGSNIFAGHLGNFGMTADGGGVVRSLDDGTTWASASVGLSGLNSRAIASNGTDIFAGTYYFSGIFKSINTGASWTRSFLPGTTPNYQVLSMITVGSTLFAGVNNVNNGYRSTDNGVTWTATASTAKPIWALGANATYLFAGTSTDGMRRSTNNGTSWTTINTGLTDTGQKSIRAITVSGSKIYIGNARGVYVSSNDGTNWTAINGGVGSPGYSSVKTIIVKGDTLLAGASGSIVRSTNHGATWTALPSTSGMCNALLLSGTTIYAGGTAGVYVSNDWGVTWTSFNDQFPTAPEVNTLFMANNSLYAGTYGMSVWKYSFAQPPVAFAVTGGGSACEGGSGLPVGLSNSELGVTYILYKNNVAQIPTVIGTGSPITFGNQFAGTYTIVGTNSFGTTPMTGSATITETPAVAVSVTISADVNPVPFGSTVTLTAVPVNGGTTPSFQWKVNGTLAGTDNSVLAYIPVNQDTVSCMLTSSEACTTGNPAMSNAVVLTIIPDTVSLHNIVVSSGDTNCYDALQTIFVAGNGNTFTVQPGGSATMIAGQSIIYYPGTMVHEGGYMYGYISTVFCTNPVNPVVGNTQGSGDVAVFLKNSHEDRSIRVYPNPTTGDFTLELTGFDGDKPTDVTIYNMMGKRIMTTITEGEMKKHFNLSHVPDGIYMIKILTGVMVETIKFVKH